MRLFYPSPGSVQQKAGPGSVFRAPHPSAAVHCCTPDGGDYGSVAQTPVLIWTSLPWKWTLKIPVGVRVFIIRVGASPPLLSTWEVWPELAEGSPIGCLYSRSLSDWPLVPQGAEVSRASSFFNSQTSRCTTVNKWAGVCLNVQEYSVYFNMNISKMRFSYFPRVCGIMSALPDLCAHLLTYTYWMNDSSSEHFSGCKEVFIICQALGGFMSGCKMCTVENFPPAGHPGRGAAASSDRWIFTTRIR